MTAELIEYTIPTVSEIWPGEAIDADTLEQECFMVPPTVVSVAKGFMITSRSQKQPGKWAPGPWVCSGPTRESWTRSLIARRAGVRRARADAAGAGASRVQQSLRRFRRGPFPWIFQIL